MCLAYYMSAVGSCRCRQPRTITDFSWSNSATIAFLLWHTIYLGLLVQCNFAGDIKGGFSCDGPWRWLDGVSYGAAGT